MLKFAAAAAAFVVIATASTANADSCKKRANPTEELICESIKSFFAGTIVDRFDEFFTQDVEWSWREAPAASSIPGFKEIYVGKNGFVTDVSNGTFAAVGFSDVFDDATYTTTGNTIIVSYKAQTATVANNPRKSCTINNNNIEYVKQADGIKLTHVRFRSVPCIDALFVPTPNEQTAKKVVTTFFDGTFFEPAVYDASFAKDANYTWTEAMPSIPGFVQSLKGFDAFLADTKTGVWSKIVFPKGDWVYTEVDKCVIGDNKGNTASKPDGTECGTYDGMVKWCFNDQGLVEHSTFLSSQVWDDCYWEKKSKKDTAKTVIASFFDQSLAQSITYHSLFAADTITTWDQNMPCLAHAGKFNSKTVGYEGWINDLQTGIWTAVLFAPQEEWKYTENDDGTVTAAVKQKITKVGRRNRRAGHESVMVNGSFTVAFDTNGRMNGIVHTSTEETNQMFCGAMTPEEVVDGVLTSFQDGTLMQPIVYHSYYAKDASSTWDQDLPSIPGFVRDRTGGHAGFMKDITEGGIWATVGFSAEPAFTVVENKDGTFTADRMASLWKNADPTVNASNIRGGFDLEFTDGKISKTTFISDVAINNLFTEKRSKKAVAQGIFDAFYGGTIVEPITYQTFYAANDVKVWEESMKAVPGFRLKTTGLSEFTEDLTDGVFSKVRYSLTAAEMTATKIEGDQSQLMYTTDFNCSRIDTGASVLCNGGFTLTFNDAGLVTHTKFVAQVEVNELFVTKWTPVAVNDFVLASFYDGTLLQTITWHSAYEKDAVYGFDKSSDGSNYNLPDGKSGSRTYTGYAGWLNDVTKGHFYYLAYAPTGVWTHKDEGNGVWLSTAPHNVTNPFSGASVTGVTTGFRHRYDADSGKVTKIDFLYIPEVASLWGEGAKAALAQKAKEVKATIAAKCSGATVDTTDAAGRRRRAGHAVDCDALKASLAGIESVQTDAKDPVVVTTTAAPGADSSAVTIAASVAAASAAAIFAMLAF